MRLYDKYTDQGTNKWNHSSQNEKNESRKDEDETLDNYLDIFKEANPHFEDVNERFLLSQRLLILIIGLIICILQFMLYENIWLSFTLITLEIVGFIVCCSENIYRLSNLSLSSNTGVKSLHPFKKFFFWQQIERQDTLYMLNKDDAETTAMKIFSIETIPENIHASINLFLKGLYGKRLGFTYQIVQTPKIFDSQQKTMAAKRGEMVNSISSIKTKIYILVCAKASGILRESTIEKLNTRLDLVDKIMAGNFKMNFHHYQIRLLRESYLITAFTTFLTKREFSDFEEKEYSSDQDGKYRLLFLKAIFFGVILVYFNILFCQFVLDLTLIILTNLVIIGLIIFIYLRSLLSFLSLSDLSRQENVVRVNPFKNMKFYYSKEFPGSLFIHYDQRYLFALKFLNLQQAYVCSKTYIYPNKLFRASVGLQIPMAYTVFSSPISFSTFDQLARNQLNPRAYKSYLRLDSMIKEEQWIEMRSGLWRTILNLTVCSTMHTKYVDKDVFSEIEQELSQMYNTWASIFEMEFPGYYLRSLKGFDLLQGLYITTLKSKFFRKAGSHMTYHIFQGKTLMHIIRIVDDFKKGIRTKVAAEFNTPLDMPNAITIGKTINTEFLETEIDAGFTKAQTKRLLLANGTFDSREQMLLKIVSEQIKNDIPSLVFDFTGRFKTLFSYFQNSRFSENLLYFQLGKSFNLQLLKSGIPNEENNMLYIDYVMTLYGLIYKKPERVVENLKALIQNSPDMDLASLSIAQQNSPEWENSPLSDSIVALFQDFSQTTISILSPLAAEENYINIHDFIGSNKTVILDFSLLTDLSNKLFLAFVIVVKCIRYIEQKTEFHPKTFVIPHIDKVWNEGFLDRQGKVNYDLIDKIVEPLLTRNFGLLCSADRISYLHPHLFGVFQNYITFRVTTKGDIAVLKNVMDLQELKGAGYYSRKRENTYQIEYLKQLEGNEIIMKRSDLLQPFPVEIEPLVELNSLTKDQLYDHMDKLGYDLHFSERKLLLQAKNTLFEKDLGKYYSYLQEIMRFLKSVQTLENIGNLNKNRLKKELMKAIELKARKHTNNKKPKMTQIRNNLFEILTTHKYLVECHPKNASGAQSMRPSYKVGQQYFTALADYYDIKKEKGTATEKEYIKKEIKNLSKDKSNQEEMDFIHNEGQQIIIDDDLETKSQPKKDTVKDVVHSIKLKTELANKLGKNLIYSLNTFQKLADEGEYDRALHLAEQFIPTYLVRLKERDENIEMEEEDLNRRMNDNDIKESIDYLTTHKIIPFDADELHYYVQRTKFSGLKNDNVEGRIEELYRLMNGFIFRIQSYFAQRAIR